MFQLPPNFNQYIQSLMGGNQMGAGTTYTPSGTPYTGPFGNDTRTPFRTVAPNAGGFQPAYNRGLNASSAQLYDYFRSKPGKTAHDYGLNYAGATQTFDDFLNRGRLMQTEIDPEQVVDPDGGGPGSGPGGIQPPKFPTAWGGGFPGVFTGGWQGIFNLNPEQMAEIGRGRTTGVIAR